VGEKLVIQDGLREANLIIAAATHAPYELVSDIAAFIRPRWLGSGKSKSQAMMIKKAELSLGLFAPPMAVQFKPRAR